MGNDKALVFSDTEYVRGLNSNLLLRVVDSIVSNNRFECAQRWASGPS